MCLKFIFCVSRIKYIYFDIHYYISKKLELQRKTTKTKTTNIRRIRGDLIEAYTIVHKKYDPDVCNVLKLMTDSEIRYSTRINVNKIME